MLRHVFMSVRLRAGVALAAALAVLVGLLQPVGAAPASAHDGTGTDHAEASVAVAEAERKEVLLLQSSLSGGAYSSEVRSVQAAGLTPVLVSDAQWSTMTTADFARYRAIIIATGNCANPRAAEQNAATWGQAVTGNVVIAGADPWNHSAQTERQLLSYVVSDVANTGAYITLRCTYDSAGPNTRVPVLEGLRPGGFTVRGAGCYDNAHIVATHPALSGLTDSMLSWWGCSVHSQFDTWPPDYEVLAIARNTTNLYTASDGTVGTPYIIASGSGLQSVGLSMDPKSGVASVGGRHTVTARLSNRSDGKPVADSPIGFAITAGPDTGVSGTCAGSSTCTTNADGQVSWTFANGGAPGVDTVRAFVDTNKNGKADAGEQQTTAGMTWTTVTLALQPSAAPVSLIGTEHCVTAVVQDAGSPVNAAHVDFRVTGSNSAAGSADSGFDGRARFCYRGANAGADTITAAAKQLTATATKPWTANRPPVADAAGPYTVAEGGRVTLDGSASADPDKDQLTFAWDLDADGTFETPEASPAFSAAQLDGPSTRRVAVRVCDPHRACASAETHVQVTNVAPRVDAGAERTAFRGETWPLLGTWSDPAGKRDEPYRWSWDAVGSATSSESPYGGRAAATRSFPHLGWQDARLSVVDDDGGESSDDVRVLVVNRPPSCAQVATPLGQIWPPNHEMVPVPVTGASDPDGDAVEIQVVQIAQDEPLNALGDGSTERDGAGVGTPVAQVRAERAGTPRAPGDGRVYTVSVRVTDARGASCVRELTVGVPHDHKHATAIDSGVRYDSVTGRRLDTTTTVPTADVPASAGIQVEPAGAKTLEDAPVDVTLTARNVPGDTTSFRVLTEGPADGSVTSVSPAVCEPTGTGSICRATATYLPARDFFGTDSFRFVATDGTTGWEGVARISVGAANDAPVLTATPETLVVAEDSGDSRVDVLATDVETPAADLRVELVDAPARGTVLLDGQPLQAGATWTGSTRLTFRTAADHFGGEQIRLAVTDTGSEGLPAGVTELTVPITVTAVDDAPVAPIVEVTTDEDTPVTLALRATDVDSAGLAFVADAPASGTIAGLSTPECVTALGMTTCTSTAVYTPAKNANGTVALSFQVKDSTTTTPLAARVDVRPVNDAPTVTSSPAKLDINEDSGSHTVTFTGTDVETPAAKLQLRVDTLPSRGTLRVGSTVLQAGAVIGASTGQLTYQPAANAFGIDRFAVAVVDGTEGGGDSLTGRVEVPVTIAGVDDAPTLQLQTATTPEDVPVVVTLKATDIDSRSLTFNRFTSPTRGTATAATVAVCQQAGDGASCTSTVTYTPKPDLHGVDSFGVWVTDGRSTVSTGAAVSVTPVNDVPVAAADTALAEEGVALRIPVADLLKNDSRGPADEATQQLSVTAVTAGAQTNGTAHLDSSGVTYTSTDGFRGNATFTYTVCDNGTTNGRADAKCADGVVTVNVAPRNRLPVIDASAVSTDEDTPTVVTLRGTDADGNPLQFSVAAAPTAGSLGAISTPECTAGSAGSVCTATVTYTPRKDYNGLDGLTVRVSDGRGTADAVVSVAVSAVNDVPAVVASDKVTVAEDASAVVKVHASDVETAAGELSVRLDKAPARADVFIGERKLVEGDAFAGAPVDLRLVPHADTVGSDALRLVVTDKGDGPAAATSATRDIAVAVTDVNDAPLAGAFSLAGKQDELLTFPVSELTGAGSAGPENESAQTLTVRSVSLKDTSNGSVGLANGTVSFQPATGFSGTAVVTYELCDNGTTAGAADAKCVVGEARLDIRTVGPAPAVTDVAPVDGARVTAPVAVTAGIATTDGSTITSWRVTAALVDGGAPITVAEGTGTPPATLGTFDPTVLTNGVYRIVVSAETSAGGTSGTETTVVVDGQLKLGRFAATYKDADAALGDVVLPVMRSYDSLDKTVGDFGYGWKLSLDGMRVSSNRVLGAGGWEQYDTNCRFGICQTGYRATVPHFVAVTFPDGRIESFDLTPKDTGSRSFARVEYTARKGTTSTLTPIEAEDVVFNGDGDLRSMDDLEPYDPKQFKLTTRAGQVLVLDVAGGLLSLRDLDGTTYEVTDTGVNSTAGGGATWTRDGQGRITAIRSGGTTKYVYDAAGNLASVTDPAGRTTTYTYDRHHRMLAANGPGGTPLRTMNYDAQGRLVSITDADGNTTEISSDAGARTQTITDPTGKLTTVLTMDVLGGVLKKVEVSGGESRTWSYTYDADGRQSSETDPLGRVTKTTYNAAGDVLSRTDPAGRTSTFTYGQHGEVLSNVDAAGRTTKYGYDSSLHLTSVTDAAGKAETYTYDASGRMTAVTDRRGGTTKYAYDGGGRVTSRTDALGRATRYTYDESGQLATSTDGAGAETRYERDAAGQLLSSTDPTGGVTSYSYDPLGRTMSRTDATGGKTAYTYTAGGKLATTTDPVGGRTSYEYDPAGRLLAETRSDGARETYIYDAFGRLVKETDAAGHSTAHDYDAVGQLAATVYPNGGRTSYTYDLLGRVTGTTDVAGGTTKHTYDTSGLLVSRTDAVGRVTRFEYDVLGRRTSVVDPAGGVTRSEYDAKGSVVATVDATGARTTYEHDASGQLVRTKDATGRATSFAYDAAGRTTTTTDASGGATVTSYDAAGRPLSLTMPSGAKTTYRYDAAGRLVETVDPLGHRSTKGYDDAGRLVSETDALGRTVRFALDAAGRTTAITDALGGSVRLGHDRVGNLVSVTDPVGVQTSYEYDASGNRIAEVDGLGNRQTWVYDEAGRVTQARNARGQVTTSSYDAAGQLVKRTTPEGDVAQSFDAVGRRTKLIDRSGTTTFGYDAVSRLTSMTSVAGEVSYSYDAAGRRESLTAGGHTASYAYDAAGRLSTVTVGAAVTRYAHDADGQVASITRPNGVVSSYGYDAAGRVTDLSHVKSGTDVASFRYTLDAAGNRTAVDGPSGKESYTLDAGGRLTKVTYGDGETVSYGYDAAGNRTSSTAGGTTTVYGYDAAGRLDSVGGSSVKRDADGNVLSEGGRSYGYDSGNQLVDMSAGGVTTQYGYDGDGRRVSTRTGAQAPVGSVYDSTGDYPVLLARGATTFQRDSTGALLGETTGGTTLTPLVDALGTVRATTSASGAVVGTAAYDVYGAVRATTGPQSVLGFTGAPSDAAGLVDLNAREYSPALGQFLQRDTVRPAGEGTVGWNTFTYGNNNPTTYTDPSGHMALTGLLVEIDIDATLRGIETATKTATLNRARQLLAQALVDATAVTFATYCLTTDNCDPTKVSLPDWAEKPNPKRPPLPDPMPPGVGTGNDSADALMRFQIQKGTSRNFSTPAWNDARAGVTVEQALAALYVSWGLVEPTRARILVHGPVVQTANWILEQPGNGGVVQVGNVFRRWSEMDTSERPHKKWRVDVENNRGHNLKG